MKLSNYATRCLGIPGASQCASQTPPEFALVSTLGGSYMIDSLTHGRKHLRSAGNQHGVSANTSGTARM